MTFFKRLIRRLLSQKVFRYLVAGGTAAGGTVMAKEAGASKS